MSNPSQGEQFENAPAPAPPAKEEKKQVVNEVLETSQNSASNSVVMKSKKRRGRQDSRPSRSRKSDIPDCKTVDKCSAKSNSESSQDGWLNDIVKDAKKKSILDNALDFINGHKLEIASGVVITGLIVYFIMKRTCTKTCPFTGKTSK